MKSKAKSSKQDDYLSDINNFFGLPERKLIDAYRYILTARTFDDRIETMIRQGKAGFLISGSGHEAAQVAAAMALTPGKDWCFTYYRDTAFGMAMGISAKDFFRHSLAKATDPFTGGRQMSLHLGSKELRIPTSSSPTGTQYLQAVGAAKSALFRNTDEIAYVTGGEGSTSQGEFYEAINWASREKLPVIFMIQNNKYAISVPVESQAAGGSVFKTVSGFAGLNRFNTDGTDFLMTYGTLKHAVELARAGEGPSLVYADVVRLRSHSISDAQEKYRSKESLESDKANDPLIKMEKFLTENKILSESDIENIRKEIFDKVLADSEEVLKDPEPDPATVTRYMYCPDEEQTKIEYEKNENPGAPVTMIDAINHALNEEMENNPDMIMYGEDIADSKGGVFAATKGLSTKYGNKRVFNSPLAEASIVGTAVGMAVTGLKPAVEIQFIDYIFPAMMQIKDEVSMYRYRSNNQFTANVLIRTACGGYIQGGHYHSINLEGLFAKCEGIKIAYPSNARDAKGLLKTACRLKDPVLFMEHKFLYRQSYAKSPEPSKDFYIPFGKAEIKNPGEDITIVTYGVMVEKSMRAARKLAEKNISVEVIDLRTIVPLDMETVLNSVKKTGKIMIVYEDSKFMGFGAEIAAQISEKAFEYLDAPIKRVAALDVHIPYSQILENAVLPQDETILKECEKLAEY
jgi:2-oxoisovalerate dehydrogenase E1 component